MWKYYRAILEIPMPVVLLAIFGPAVIFALAVLAYRGALRTSAWRAAFVFPMIWVCYEYIFARVSPHSTFGNVGYSQMNFLPIIQVASVTGIWGISFCLFLFAGTLSVLLCRDATVRQKCSLAAVVGVLLGAVMGFGIWRLNAEWPAKAAVSVGLLASDLPKNILTEEHADTMRLLREYAAQAENVAVDGAHVIVIPEKVSIVLDSDLPEVDALFQSIAAKTDSSIVVGVVHPTTGARWNEAREYSPDGTVRTYEKHHMVPGFESSLTVGTARIEWREPSRLFGLWAMAICKDMDFPDLSREYGKDGIGLLLVPAWDFKADGWLHGRMAILRGVESGFSIARSPKEGILTVSDDRGRVLAQRDSKSAPFITLLARVPVRHTQTIYAQFGDWFAWLNIIALIALIAEGRIRRRLA